MLCHTAVRSEEPLRFFFFDDNFCIRLGAL